MDKKEKKRPVSPLRIVIFLVGAAIFAYAAYQLYAYFSENLASKNVTDNLTQQAVTLLPTTEKNDEKTDTQPETMPSESLEEDVTPDSGLSDTIPIQVDFDALQAQNPDIIAWIYCADTQINYPVVQGEDNQYYVSHLPDGTYNGSGSIFMDFRNASDLSDRNSLIYGHNMSNKTMFSSLIKYKDQMYYDEHPEMWILTRECAYRVDLIAGAVVASDSDAYQLMETKEELDAHLQKYVSLSTFTTECDLSNVEHIITLSTCSYEYRTARYVVLGSLVPILYAE